MAVAATVRLAGGLLAGRREPSAADVVAAARLTRHRDVRAGRSVSLISAIVVLAVSVSPAVAQVAPSDTATADLNKRSGRVVVVMSPVPSGAELDELRRVPGVLNLTAPVKDGDTRRYDLTCAQVRLLLIRDWCAPGTQTSIGDLDQAQSAAWPFTKNSWLIAELTPQQAKRSVTSQPPGTSAGHVIGMVSDPDAYWRLVSVARALDPRASVQANVGGLSGGSNQTYLRMQEWLRAGLLLLLITLGAVTLLAAAHDVRDRVRLRWALHAIGAGRGPFLAALRRELLIRSTALLVACALATATTAHAATGWASADPFPRGWLALIYGSLVAIALLATLVPLLAGALLRPTRSSDDISTMAQRPL